MIALKKVTKKRQLNIETNRRIIFVSDIHGDYNTFKYGLESLGFNQNDYLFIIGDIYEKGDAGMNLKTLRYVQELAKKPNVYPMAGNCDEVFRFIMPDDQKERFLYYIVDKKHSVLNDIADIEGIKVDRNLDFDMFRHLIDTKYHDCLDFIDSLDDIIFINDKLVLVHGGVDDINNLPKYSLSMLKYDKFYDLGPKMPMITIVGHYPTRNYRHDIACCNPILDMDKKIFSIDGGNHVCKGGQINFLILDNLENMNFSYKYFDHYPKYKMTCDVNYENPKKIVSLSFENNEVEVLDQDLDFYLVLEKKTNQKLWVHSSYLFKDKNGVYRTYDATNLFLSLNKGDEISVIIKANPYSLVKKNGYIGMIETKYIENED